MKELLANDSLDLVGEAVRRGAKVTNASKQLRKPSQIG